MDYLTALSKEINPCSMLRKHLRGIVIGVLATVLGVALYIYTTPMVGSVNLETAVQKFQLYDTPKELPEIHFINEKEQLLTLQHFSGKTILLNIWATWCPPCVDEMPTLDRLQALLGSDDFEVIALSIDQVGMRVVNIFYDQIEVNNLQIYMDDSTKSATLLNALGLPSTLLINAQGQELGRLIGPAEWDSPEMVAFLQSYIESP